MRVLMLAEVLALGGLETHVIELSRGLVARGHRVTVAAAHISDWCREALAAGEVEVCGDLPVPPAVTSVGDGPDLIHAHPMASLAWGADLAARLGVKLVITCHGAYGVEAVKAVSGCAAAVICVSREAYAEVARAAGGRAVLIQNGVDTERFRPRPHRFGGRILYAARLGEGQALCALALQAAAKWLRGLAVTVAGDGPALERLQSRGVACLGWVPDLAAVLPEFDIGAGTGRTVRECMASGLPALVLGPHGYDGVVGPGNVDDLEALNFSGRVRRWHGLRERLHRDLAFLTVQAGERRRLSEHGRERALQCYSLSQMVSATESIYAK